MSDLTPPASKHNTPQRNPETTTEMEAPASPTSMRGGSTAPAGDEIAAPGTDTVEAGPSGGPTTTDALDAGAVGAPGVEEAGQPSSGGMDIDEGDAGSETDDDRAGDDGAEKGDGDVAAVDENGKAVAADASKPKGKDKKAGKKGKDADLYESEIVERWNKEFGDVCLATPAKA